MTTQPNPAPTERQLALAHYDDHQSVRLLRYSFTTEDLLDIWEAVSNWVEEAEDFTTDDDLNPEELAELKKERDLNDRMEVLMKRFHQHLRIIPVDLRS